MLMTPPALTMRDLARATGVSARTLRRWTRGKLLPRAIGRGSSARYGDEHLLRAKRIRQLRAERRSLSEIREQLAHASPEQLATPSCAALLNAPPEPVELAYPSASWELVQLGTGLMLLVNPTAGPAVRRRAAQLYQQCAAAGAGAALGEQS